MKTALFTAALLFGSVFQPLAAGTAENPQPELPPLQDQIVTIGEYRVTARIDPQLELEPLNFQMRSPRVIHFSEDRMFIGSKAGDVYWLDPPYTEANLLLKTTGYPHSVIVRNNRIYIARSKDILVAEYTRELTSMDLSQFKKFLGLPAGGQHSSRTLKLGPDNRLYVSLGIAGNCSDQWLDQSYPESDRRGGIFVIDESSAEAELKPFASGLRNPVGFDWTPDGSAIYASNNGPDHHGFDQPPEQFVRITAGANYGAPWFQFDGEQFNRDPCVESNPPFHPQILTPPEALFAARNAPMDVAFIPDQEVGVYQRDAIVALHGSWATRDGDAASRRHPGLVRVAFHQGHATGVYDLLRGFQLPDGRRWGRPMGVAIGPDGNIYFTSDAGIEGLYRLRWRD